MINLLLLAYAKYSLISQHWILALVQLFAPPTISTNPATHQAEKIPFINLQKPYSGYQQCEHKY